jgi:hypothetical protein
MTDVLSSHHQWSRHTMRQISKQQHQYKKPTRRALRKITLYRNGDRYFPGKQISIIPQNYINLQLLLNELSSIIDLPYGVRHLFTPDNGSEITDVNILRDGASYVCASFEPFQKLEYTTISATRVNFDTKQRKYSLVYFDRYYILLCFLSYSSDSTHFFFICLY